MGQRVEYYEYGYGGIEKGITRGDTTYLFCDSLSKAQIRYEVMDSIEKLYKTKRLKIGYLKVKIRDAEVYGKLRIRRKNHLVVFNYTYDKVVYSDGLIQQYREPKKKKTLKK